jgi:hypothetical protein
MCKRILILLAVSLMATACVHGVKQMPAEVPKPDVTIPAGQLALCPETLPELVDGKRSSLLLNHVDSAKQYHACGADHKALVCTVTGLTGITINGADPVQPEACKVPAKPL